MYKIIKSVLVVLFFSALFNLKLYAEVVKKIEIQGNERISSETIILFGDISTDKDYNSSDINNLIKKLYETSFFSNLVTSFCFESPLSFLKGGFLKFFLSKFCFLIN